jgi:hypothetical protein
MQRNWGTAWLMVHGYVLSGVRILVIAINELADIRFYVLLHVHCTLV